MPRVRLVALLLLYYTFFSLNSNSPNKWKVMRKKNDNVCETKFMEAPATKTEEMYCSQQMCVFHMAREKDIYAYTI